jgi:anaerobic magnesium-protoporphyrin IX monomethyl ester cyclase
MNIKIIEPYDFDRRYDIRSLTPGAGPVVIATLLKKNGYDAQVLSEYVTHFNPEDLNKADFVGISITTYNAKKGFEIARHIQKPVVFGGFHASLMPEECLNYGDYVIRGDGYPIVELVHALSHRGDKDLGHIPNLVYRVNGRVVYNRTESRPTDIVPDYSLVKDYFKLNKNRLLRIPLLVNGSRGCHCNCAFCSIIEVYGGVEKKEIQLIIDDIKSQTEKQHFLSRFLTRVIWITDDNFSSDPKWAKDLMAALSAVETPYELVLQARVDVAEDEELLELMKRAKIGIVYLGIESVDQASLDSFSKRTTTEQAAAAIAKIRNYGMEVHGLFVFGDDGFKRGDGDRVARFAKQHRLSGAVIQPLTPFPGTRLFDRLEREGRILHEDWQDYNGKVVFVPKQLSAIELHEEIYRCYRRIYSPWRVLKFLVWGRRGFKMQVLGEAIFRHVEGMKSRNYIRDKLSRMSRAKTMAVDQINPHSPQALTKEAGA